MHQTTVRFGTDLWRALEREAAKVGVSAAQFVREAAVARLAQTAAQADSEPDVRAEMARADAKETFKDSAAVWSQSRQARLRARQLRDEADSARRQRMASPAPEPTASPSHEPGSQLVASDSLPPA
jgi:hypothetical protein